MKTFIQLLLVAAITFCYSANTLNAQNTTYYHMLSYMKVKPGDGDDYVAMEAAWKKIHAARVAKGEKPLHQVDSGQY